MNAVDRLSKKLELKLADKNYYEAHQLYNTISFRLQREIDYSSLKVEETARGNGSGPRRPDETTLIATRLTFINTYPAFAQLLEFLAGGAETLFKSGELIAGNDLFKAYLTQFTHAIVEKPDIAPVRGCESNWDRYFEFLAKWFARTMAVFASYAQCGGDMMADKERQANSKGFVEADFVSDRDSAMERILQMSKNIRVPSTAAATDTDIKFQNMFNRLFGVPQMHLQNGRTLVRGGDLAKARHCFTFSNDPFEAGKFLYFYAAREHNRTEYELVVVRQLMRTFSVQLLLNSKANDARHRNPPQKFAEEQKKRYQLGDASDEEMSLLRRQALHYVKQLFYYTVTVTKVFMARQGGWETPGSAQPDPRTFFRQCPLLQFFNFYLLILEEFLRLEDVVPQGSWQHFQTNFVRQLVKHLRFDQAPCFPNDQVAAAFVPFLARNAALSQSLSDANLSASKEESKAYLLRLYHELRTNTYKSILQLYQRLDPDFDVDFIDRVFFIYYNSEGVARQDWPGVEAPPTGSSCFFEADGVGGQARGAGRSDARNPMFNLLSGFADIMAGGSSSGPPGPNPSSLMDFLNDFL